MRDFTDQLHDCHIDTKPVPPSRRLISELAYCLDRETGGVLSCIVPCSDVTEILSLTIDHEDRVIHYSLAKLTCGAAVGNPSLLLKWIDKRPASEVLSSTLDDVLAVLPTRSQTWEYLTLKHLTAVQHGLRAMIGLSRGGPDDSCAVQTIETGERGITLLALVRVDLITSEIEACGNCCRGKK